MGASARALTSGNLKDYSQDSKRKISLAAW